MADKFIALCALLSVVKRPNGRFTTLSVFSRVEPDTRLRAKNDDYQKIHDARTVATGAPISISDCVMGQQIPPCAGRTNPTAYKQYYHAMPPHE